MKQNKANQNELNSHTHKHTHTHKALKAGLFSSCLCLSKTEYANDKSMQLFGPPHAIPNGKCKQFFL